MVALTTSNCWRRICIHMEASLLTHACMDIRTNYILHGNARSWKHAGKAGLRGVTNHLFL